MIRLYYKNVRSAELTKTKKFKKGSWIYVKNPTDKDVDKLVQNFGLEEGLIKDALDEHEAPRIEVEEGITYIYTRFVYETDNEIKTAPLLVSIGNNFFVTICNQTCSPLNVFVNNQRNFNTTQKTKFLLQILLSINSDYKTYIHKISRKINNLSYKLEKLENKDIVRFVEDESVLNEFLASLIPTALIFEKMLYDKTLTLYEEDEDLVEDLALSNNQLIASTKSSLKRIVNIREAYSIITTSNLNKTMKMLTSITILLTIPTIVTSFYGMNVALPLDHNPLAYLWIIFGTLVVSTALLVLFFKNKLL